MPFMSFPDDEELKKWADDEWEKLSKCDYCGLPLGKETFCFSQYPSDAAFCSSYCAERAYEHECAEMEEDDAIEQEAQYEDIR
jgi:hypothetical protein